MKNLLAEGSVPMDDNYKLLLNNVFAVQELGVISSALASTLKSLMSVKGFDVEHQIQYASTALGKILLSIPEELRAGLLKAFASDLGLDFRLNEINQPELKH